MKSMVMPQTVQLTQEEKDQLTKEVKEVLAVTVNVNRKKSFTAAEMWNSRRNSRSASSRIRRWNLN